MADAFDRIVITVPELERAVTEYAALLGRDAHAGDAGSAWFVLSNTTIELREAQLTEANRLEVSQPETDQPGTKITGLVLRDLETAKSVKPIPNSLGLSVGICDGSSTAGIREVSPSAISVDHLVLRTEDAESCVDFFSGELGVRLALDKTVVKWGGRMLFFRAGKMTLEVIEADDSSSASTAEGSHFWGLAYQHPDLAQLCIELAARGVTCSELRDGRKPGTRVATVKSHCLGIPTLLIQPSA